MCPVQLRIHKPRSQRTFCKIYIFCYPSTPPLDSIEGVKHLFLTFALIASMLFTAVEAVAEELVDDHHATQGIAELTMDGKTSHVGEPEGSQDHCGHCFHSHAGHPLSSAAVSTNFSPDQYVECHVPRLVAFLQAPPTPPPNS